jgi:hypothetical protein
MNYRAMPLECYCGEAPEQILEVGFTSDHHMVIHYWCSACNRVVFLTRTLDECRDFCPLPDVDTAAAAADDVRFLESLGISSGD